MNAQIHSMQDKRAAEVAAAKVITAKAEAEGRDLTDDETLAVERHVSRSRQISEEIRDAERVERDRLERVADLAEPVETNWPGTSIGQRRPSRDGSIIGRLFGNGHLSTDGWKSKGEFLRCLTSGSFDGRLRSAGMSENIPASGGFLIAPEYARDLLAAAIEKSVVLQYADVVPVNSSEYRVSGFDPSDHSSGLYGMTASWVAEGESFDIATPATVELTLKPKKLALLTSMTNELRDDLETAKEPRLWQQLIDCVGFELDDAFLSGTGSGQPLGVLSADSRVTVAKEDGQTAATITNANICAMVGRLYPSCWAKSVWLAHPSVLPQLFGLQSIVTNGSGTPVGGSESHLFTHDSAGNFALAGRPLVVSEKVSALGTEGDLTLCDLSQYVVGLRKEIALETSGHVYFASDKTAIRVICRADGQPRWSNAVTPRNGDDDLSWCVTLASRTE